MLLGTPLQPPLSSIVAKSEIGPQVTRDRFLPAPDPDNHLQALSHPLKVVATFLPHAFVSSFICYLFSVTTKSMNRLEGRWRGIPKSALSDGKA